MKETYVFSLAWELDVPGGGVNEVVKNLYGQFDLSSQYRPVVMIDDWTSWLPRYQSSEGRETVRMRCRPPVLKHSTLKNLFHFFAELPFILYRNWKFVHKHNVAAINAHYPTLSVVHWILLKKLGLFDGEIILSLHGRDLREAARTTGVALQLWRWTYRNCDSIVPCAAGLSDEVLAAFPNAASKLKVIHNGIDVDETTRRSQASHTQAHLPALDNYILNIATFDHTKGQDVLLKAYALLRSTNPGTPKLVMVGRTGSFLPEIERLLDKLKLNESVSLIRDIPQNDVLPILAGAKLFVLSSRFEAFSIAMLEAAALAVPIVATDVCGVKELIPSDTFGVVVPPDSPALLADAIRTALTSSSDSMAKSAKLKARVVSTFTWRAALDGYLTLLPKQVSS